VVQDVIKFWFEETEPSQWWQKDKQFDREIAARFGRLHDAAVKGELSDWRDTPEGRLAEIIVLDQFSRNIYRDRPEAFAYDALAVVLTQEAIRSGDDKKLPIEQRGFLYMPLMHSESLQLHDTAMKVFDQPGLEGNYEAEVKHKAIIEKFGRYPHRNQILGRESTLDELGFLKMPGSSF